MRYSCQRSMPWLACNAAEQMATSTVCSCSLPLIHTTYVATFKLQDSSGPRLRTSALLQVAARCNGVFPQSPMALGSAPAARSCSTTSTMPSTSVALKHAQCNAVSPTSLTSFTAALTLSRDLATSAIPRRQAAIIAVDPSVCRVPISDRATLLVDIHAMTSLSAVAWSMTETSCGFASASTCWQDSSSTL